MDHLERYREIIPDFEDFLATQSRMLGSTARINTLKMDRDRLLERLRAGEIGYETFPWYPLGLRLKGISPGKLLENLMGYIHIQEELSMVPPVVLDPRPGETVLDLCASPGSKTTQISQMMENRGLVIANEPSLARVAPLRYNCERLGVLNVAITRYDGRNFPADRCSFDRVLVDAPCSSEGRARTAPAVLARCSRSRSLNLAALQVDLLHSALRLTKKGGVVVYSTCTFAPEENEQVVEKVLDMAHLEKISIPGLRQCPGIAEWEGRPICDDLQGCARYYPHQNDTGGFFVARLIKD